MPPLRSAIPSPPPLRRSRRARIAGVLCALFVHVLLVLALIERGSEPEPPAALPPLRISLLAAPIGADAPPSVEVRPVLPGADPPLPSVTIEDPAPPPPMPPAAASAVEPPGPTPAQAPSLQRRDARNPDCLPRGWLMQVSQSITFAMNYPAASRQLGERGTAYVRISVARSGRVIEAPLLLSSGYRNLDYEAGDVIRRIGRFAPLAPTDCAGFDVIVIDQPIRFGG